MSKRNKFDGNDRQEYGKTLYRDIFIVLVLLVMFSDFIVFLWKTFKRDPSEGFHILGFTIGRFFNGAWETWAIGGILLVAFLSLVFAAEKVALVMNKLFDFIVKSKIMVIAVRLGLIGLVGGWLYFIFS